MRQATISRNTTETTITVQLTLDGSGQAQVASGIGFFDHMLAALAKHARLDLVVTVEGDLFVDDHHTVEDTGLVLGQAMRQALGDRRGVVRFGQALVPMDDALASAALDLSGRPWLSFDAAFTGERVGAFSTQMTEEFFRALVTQAGITLHLSALAGRNDHHIVEALFKAFARALRQACARDPQASDEVPSTKGLLA